MLNSVLQNGVFFLGVVTGNLAVQTPECFDALLMLSLASIPPLTVSADVWAAVGGKDVQGDSGSKKT